MQFPSLKKIFERKAPKLPPGITTSVITGKRTAAYLRKLGCNPMPDKPMSLLADRNKDGTWTVKAYHYVPTMPFEFFTLEEKRIERTLRAEANDQDMLNLLAGFEEAARKINLSMESALPRMSLIKKFAQAYFGQTHIIRVLQDRRHLQTARPWLFTAERLKKLCRKGNKPG